MEENMKVWNAVKKPPLTALRQIQGGRLKGKTDINPQWRYQVMTEQFGMCGRDWGYEVVRVWNEPLGDGQILAFAEIKLDVGGGLNIPGIGGSMLVEKEKEGLHANDEGYKMAITDALSVAMKMLGVGADIYAGLYDGSKYKEDAPKPQEKPKEPTKLKSEPLSNEPVTDVKKTLEADLKELFARKLKGWTPAEQLGKLNVMSGGNYTRIGEAFDALSENQKEWYLNLVKDIKSML